jgi:hypothetical protein
MAPAKWTQSSALPNKDGYRRRNSTQLNIKLEQTEADRFFSLQLLRKLGNPIVTYLVIAQNSA